MSSIRYTYTNNVSYYLNNEKIVKKESIIDGTKGLSFLFLFKNNEKFYRLIAKEISKDKFSIKEKINDKETNTELDLSDLKKMLKNKDLEFVKNYIEKEQSKFKNDKSEKPKNDKSKSDKIKKVSKKSKKN
jgi:hypothetical protein